MKKGIVSIVFICSIILSGCSNDNEQEYYMWEESTEDFIENKDSNWITREYLIENGIFTSEEIEGIDVDKLVREYGWTEGIEKNENFKKYFMRFGKDYLLPQYTINYEYIEEKAKYPIWNQLEKAKDSIVRLGFWESSGMELYTMVFDFEKKVAYYGFNESAFEKRVEPGVSVELSEQQIEEINQLLSENDFFEWDSKYIDGDENLNDNPDSSLSWNFYVEVEDGKIYKIYGSNEVPDTYGEVRDSLMEYFKGAQGYPW